jgi:hypothetical protein
MQFGRRVPTSTFHKILLYSYSGQHSCTLKKLVNFSVAITEMYPRIAWELDADPLGSAKHTLVTPYLTILCYTFTSKLSPL